MTATDTHPAHHDARIRFVEVGDANIAYRRLGTPSRVPLLMLQHFRRNLDNWDPALTDALATGREVILVDYPGVASSTGVPARTVAEMARQVIAFTDALGLPQVDLPGFSIGGAHVIVATAAAGAMSPVIAGLALGGKLVTVGVSDQPIEVSTRDLIFRGVEILGSVTGISAQNEENVRVADAQGVTPIIEPAALADAAAAHARMLSGAALPDGFHHLSRARY
jgi:pimeloyl-ACP methyl ester carboxylesterase